MNKHRQCVFFLSAFPQQICTFYGERAKTNSQYLHKVHSQVARPLHNHPRLWREIFRTRTQNERQPSLQQTNHHRANLKSLHICLLWRGYYHPLPEIIGLNNILSTVISIQNDWLCIRHSQERRAGQQICEDCQCLSMDKTRITHGTQF